jgi:hypothetical protein
MPGETNLSNLLHSMQPILQHGEYVFCSISHQENCYSNLDPVGWFKEDEGVTLILDWEQADV